MASDDAPRRTGTVPRGSMRRPAPPRTPIWGVVVLLGAMGVVLFGVLFLTQGDGPRPTTAALSPTPTEAPTPTPTPTPTEDPTPTPTEAPTPTPTPTDEPTPIATPSGLAIDFPADGEVVTSRVINVIGTAPPGSTITRDIPLWFDDRTVVRDDGIWMLRVELAEGANPLAFRIGDNHETERRLTVIYEPLP